jgi:hypothetical protein
LPLEKRGKWGNGNAKKKKNARKILDERMQESIDVREGKKSS